MSFKLPPATAETFMAMELAYGPDITADHIIAFLGINPDDPMDRDASEDVGLWAWLKAYQAYKNPHEAAALEDIHLQRKTEYNPL